MAKRLKPAEQANEDAEFINQVEDIANQEVDRLTAMAEDILSKVPQRVADRLRSFRTNWSSLGSLLNSTSSDPIDPEPESPYGG